MVRVILPTAGREAHIVYKRVRLSYLILLNVIVAELRNACLR